MTSPSSSRTTRSTPCVDGCCGPMLRIISSVRIAPGVAISMSIPPPRTIQCSAADEKAARSCVSIGETSCHGCSFLPTSPPATTASARGTLTRMSATEPRRRVPSVDALLRGGPGKRAARSLGRPVVKLALRRALEEVRAAAAKGADPPADDEILARALALASDAATGLTPVINATGVVLHTGLGRAPLPEAAARAAAQAGSGYSDLEVDRATGRRGRRTARAELLLRSLTGAEAALVVNNGAAGVLLSLGALAKGKQVLVSRGELIE